MTTSAASDEQQAYFAELRQLFENQINYNRFLGMRIDSLEERVARIRIPYAEHLIGDPFRPALHGGAVSSLIDVAGGLAAFTAVQRGDRLSTVDLRVDYLRPAQLLDLVAEARLLRAGNRVAVADVTVFQDDPERPIAVGKGVYNVNRRRSSS